MMASVSDYYGMKKGSCYLNLGAGCTLLDGRLDLRPDAQNVLGWIHPTVNKRNYIKRTVDFRDMAQAFTLTVTSRLL